MPIFVLSDGFIFRHFVYQLLQSLPQTQFATPSHTLRASGRSATVWQRLHLLRNEFCDWLTVNQSSSIYQSQSVTTPMYYRCLYMGVVRLSSNRNHRNHKGMYEQQIIRLSTRQTLLLSSTRRYLLSAPVAYAQRVAPVGAITHHRVYKECHLYF